MSGVPYTFGTATTSIPLSNLDSNFVTPVTIGNASVALGNTITAIGNLTLNNVTINSGTINASVTESYSLANAVVYSNSSNVGVTSANFVFNGTNVGIGTSSPTNKFVVSNGGAAGFEIAPADGNGVAQYAYNRNTSAYVNAVYYANQHLFYYAGTTEAMRIDSSGNVGIGIASPGGRLDIAGVGRLRIDTSNDYVYQTIINASGAAYKRSIVDALQHEFYASGSEKMRIDSSGNLLVGTTSPITGSKLTVNGQLSTSGYIAINSSTVTTVATGVSFMAVFRDRGNGGAALVLYENNVTPIIVSQTTAGKFVTTSPSATQIQLANLSGGLGITALSGSTIGSTNLNVTVIANQ
jgi:hypothetical protein